MSDIQVGDRFEWDKSGEIWAAVGPCLPPDRIWPAKWVGGTPLRSPHRAEINAAFENGLWHRLPREALDASCPPPGTMVTLATATCGLHQENPDAVWDCGGPCAVVDDIDDRPLPREAFEAGRLPGKTERLLDLPPPGNTVLAPALPTSDAIEVGDRFWWAGDKDALSVWAVASVDDGACILECGEQRCSWDMVTLLSHRLWRRMARRRAPGLPRVCRDPSELRPGMRVRYRSADLSDRDVTVGVCGQGHIQLIGYRAVPDWSAVWRLGRVTILAEPPAVGERPEVADLPAELQPGVWAVPGDMIMLQQGESVRFDSVNGYVKHPADDGLLHDSIHKELPAVRPGKAAPRTTTEGEQPAVADLPAELQPGVWATPWPAEPPPRPRLKLTWEEYLVKEQMIADNMQLKDAALALLSTKSHPAEPYEPMLSGAGSIGCRMVGTAGRRVR